ncbi:MAG: hypothetical protein QNJ00_05295, partial [Woeseiaceae bacterium]|nr:hypothetical protein [Woeseiaceae bacterium]
LPLALLASAIAEGGEIPGLPNNLPIGTDRPVQVSFSNDFLGRGGSVDDFRTQQLIITTPIARRWRATVDQSILTFSEPGGEARIDQLAASLGLAVVSSSEASVHAGFGLRSVGNFAGQRMQNGFHRLTGSEIERQPYATQRDTFATAWIDAERRGRLGGAIDYWLRGSALATTDGQLDTAIAAYVLYPAPAFDAWAGLRRDWRSGYDTPVLAETADAESDLAFVAGVRWGPLVLETVQQFDNDASYGQLRFTSAPFGADGESPLPAVAIDAGMLLPDVRARFALRYSTAALRAHGAALFASIAFGEPQYGSDTSLFAETLEIGGGFEWQRPWAGSASYVAAGVGLREERLLGSGTRDGERSGSVRRGVLLASAGLRLSSSRMSERLRFRTDLGLHASVTFDDAAVAIGNEEFGIQDAALSLLLSVAFENR